MLKIFFGVALGVFLSFGIRARAIDLEAVGMDWWRAIGKNIVNINSGGVGIGTTNPTEKLTVGGNVMIDGNYNLYVGDGGTGLQRQNRGDVGSYLVSKGNAGFAWVKTMDNRTLMLMSSSGNLAVGTTVAGYRLTVVGDGSVASGNHPVASFTKNYTNGVYVGYKANGTMATAGLIYTDNQLPLVLGASNGEDYMKIERAKVDMSGGVKVNSLNNSRPACTESERGTWWFSKGVGASGAGAKDKVEVCAKDAAGMNNWRLLY